MVNLFSILTEWFTWDFDWGIWKEREHREFAMNGEMTAEMQVFYDQTVDLLTTYGWSVIGAFIILVLGFWFSKRARNLVIRAMRKSNKIDETITLFTGSLVRYLVIIFTALAVLDQFGVETTSLVALLGAAGLAIGFAMQGTLSNIAAGVMLLFFRPFKVKQYVEAGGIAGTVEGIGLFTTHLNTPDNVHIVVPNAKIWGTEIRNFNHNKTRRVQIDIGISYSDDIDKALKVALAVCTKDQRVHKDPAPMAAVAGLGASSVDLLVRVWCAGGDFWGVKFDLTKAIKEAFDKAGIEIPFPQTVIHQAK